MFWFGNSTAAVLENCCCLRMQGIGGRIPMWSIGCTSDRDRVLCMAKEMGGSFIPIVV